MPSLPAAVQAATCLALSCLTTNPAGASLLEPGDASWALLHTTPEQAGDLIYRGATFPQKGAGPEPLFRYERRVAAVPGGWVATHLTRDASQTLVIAESAQVNPAQQLQSYTVQNWQLGYRGAVQVSGDGRKLRYRLEHNGVQSTAEEAIEAPAVSGPSLFAFILAHRAELAAGQTLRVRFIAMKEKQTYGLHIRLESATPEREAYAITAGHWLLRAFIAPMRVTLDARSRTWLRYEGRVPPMQNTGGRWTALDARVDYSPVAQTYR